MKIAICGSMRFHEEMRKARKALEEAGHSVLIPKGVDLMDQTGWRAPDKDEEKIASVIEHDFIRHHF